MAVVVVGSANDDLVVNSPRFPQPGETLKLKVECKSSELGQLRHQLPLRIAGGVGPAALPTTVTVMRQALELRSLSGEARLDMQWGVV